MKKFAPWAALALILSACASPVQDKTAPSDEGPKLGFEGTLTAADYSANDGNVVAETSMGATFTADGTKADTGSQSLLVTGTSRQNRYSTDYFVEAQVALGSLAGDFSDVDTITTAVYIPEGSLVAAVNLTLIDNAGQQTLLHEQGLTAGQWNALTFDTSAVDYADPEASVSNVQALRFRFETRDEEGALSAAVSANLDSVDW